MHKPDVAPTLPTALKFKNPMLFPLKDTASQLTELLELRWQKVPSTWFASSSLDLLPFTSGEGMDSWPSKASPSSYLPTTSGDCTSAWQRLDPLGLKATGQPVLRLQLCSSPHMTSPFLWEPAWLWLHSSFFKKKCCEHYKKFVFKSFPLYYKL